MTNWQLGAIVLLPLVLTACATNPVTGDQDLVFVSEKQELELMGEKYHPEILRIYGGEYQDPEVTDYVSRIGEKIAAVSHRENIIYRFTVLDTPLINAFAIPGYIYITRGMLAFMNSEAQLAGVLGHEIGHVTARHGVRQHSKSILATIFSQAVASASGTAWAPQITDLLGIAVIRGYGREYELEADELAIEYMSKAQYEPSEMLAVLNILRNQREFDKQLAQEQGRQPIFYHGVFATHPQSEQRLAASAEDAQRAQADLYEPVIGREEYLAQITGMVFGSSKKEGIVRKERFYHADLKITFAVPKNWVVINQPNYLALHNRANTEMVILSAEDRNIKESAQTVLENTLGSNLLKGSSEPLETGLPGWTAIAKQINTPYGYTRARLALLFGDKTTYKFLAASKASEQFEIADITFLKLINSFRRLEPAEYELAEPNTIQLVEVQPGDTFYKLAQETSLNHHQEEILRLINGKYPTGELVPGEIIKTVK